VNADHVSVPVPAHAAPVEARMARNIVSRAVYVAPPLVIVAWLLAGPEGAVAGAAGVAVVVVNFLLFGAMLSGAARISLSMYHAVALGGFFVRLGMLAGTMLLVARLYDIDRMSFGMATVVTYIVLLTLEAVAVSRGRERELDWTS
jgi:hypothetical protein